MPPPADTVKVFQSHRDHVIATWRNFAIVIWRHDTSLPAIDVARKAYENVVGSFPDGGNWFTVIEENATMPSQDARNKINEVMNRSAGKTLRSALIFEGTGFRAAATRSVVTGINFVSPFPFPHKIFSTVNTGAAWFAGTVKGGMDPAELARAVESARKSPLDNTSE